MRELLQNCMLGPQQQPIIRDYRAPTNLDMVCSRAWWAYASRTSCSGELFLAAFHRGMPPIGLAHSEFWEYTEFCQAERTTRLQKWLRPWSDSFSLYLYHVGHFNVMLNALTRLITVLLIAGGVRHICNKPIYTGVMGITAPLVIRIIWISSPTRASSFGSQMALHITTHTFIIQPHVARFECGRNTHPPPLAACCLIPVYPHLIGCNLHACTTCHCTHA